MASRVKLQAIEGGLAFLRSQQLANGSFKAEASFSQTDFSKTISQPTPFATALIIRAIKNIPQASIIVGCGRQYLLDQAAADWSWNYWEKQTAKRGSEPYPDDIDDTAVALSALLDPEFETHLLSQQLGALARHLVSIEVRSAGPYRTWLGVAPSASEVWRDCDPAVNANIGYLLHELEVAVPNLENYFSDLLRSNKMQSRYYCSVVSLYAFLSAWYRGNQLSILQERADRALQTGLAGSSPLNLALGLLAAKNLRLTTNLAAAEKRLIELAAGKHWPGQALYEDPPSNGKRLYAGSAALTTAFALQALTVKPEKTLIKSPVPAPTRPDFQKLIVLLENHLGKLPGKEVAERLHAYALKLIEQDTKGYITAIASETNQAFDARLPQPTIQALNLASLYGWLAYTIYDDILDGDAALDLIGSANTALRLSEAHFRAALPGSRLFEKRLQHTFNLMDQANTWEQVYALAKVKGNILSLPGKLPDYAGLDHLAERSLGHALASMGVAELAGKPPETTALLEKFFRHYLIARQLHDDAHDWESDLLAGRLTGVTATVLLDAGTTSGDINMPQTISMWRQTFWQTTCPAILESIFSHIYDANLLLDEMSLARAEVFLEWLQDLKLAAERTRDERLKAISFMDAYLKPPPGGMV